MKHLRFLALAVLVALPLACSDDKKDTVAPITGTISGTVAVEGTGLAGVSVALVGPTSGSVTTGAGGAYSFTGVEAGSYAVAIIGFDIDDIVFGTQTKTITITTAGQVVTVDFAGSYIRTANISGNVIADGDGLAGVAVTMTGPEGVKNAVTDQAGHYSASGLRKGNYTVAITVPEGYTFANDSYEVSVGVGEAKEVSFFGEPVETVDPVTASVLIKSVQWDDGEFVDPSDVDNDIYVTLAIDPGENKLEQVCVLLDGAEVANGCQQLGSAVSDEMLQGAVLEPTFAILTDDFDEATGEPVYGNGNHTLSARLDLKGAVQSNVTTSMQLTFNNYDRVYATLDAEYNMLMSGDRWLGGLQDITFVPVLYSGKDLSWLEGYFYFDGWGSEYFEIDGDGDWPVTETFDFTDQDDYGFTTDDIDDSYVYINDGEYTDGTSFNNSNYVRLAGTDEMWFNFDFEGPEFEEDLYLTDQVDDIALACCANNWVGPDYMPIAGFYGDLPYDNGVGVNEDDYITFYVDAFDALDDGDAPDGIAIAQEGTMADAALPLSLTNDEHDLTVVAVDLFGNMSWMGMEGCGECSNPVDLYFGYDNTAPTNQTVTEQPPVHVIYNVASFGNDEGGLNVGASEDRSGFSTVPFRGYIEYWNADPSDHEYLVAQDPDDGGMVNLALAINSCDADVGDLFGGDVCYPDYTQADGVYYITGSMNNQAGVANATMVEGWVFNDQTPVDMTGVNVNVPFTIQVGDPMVFSVPVEDNLHLGRTAFGFQLEGSPGIFLPLGANIPNSDNDFDYWDDNFPTSETATITIDPAIVGVQFYGTGVADKFNYVRALHVDLAGNPSNEAGNNINVGSVEDPTDFDEGDIWDFYVSMPDAAFDLCNGQGNDDCDDTGDDTEVDIEIVVEGETGTFANPFATGDLYLYIRIDGGAAGVDADDTFYLLDVLDATDAVITDEGVGGSRFYTWGYTLTSEDVARFPGGTNIFIHAMGVKHSTGTALLDVAGNNNITVVDGVG